MKLKITYAENWTGFKCNLILFKNKKPFAFIPNPPDTDFMYLLPRLFAPYGIKVQIEEIEPSREQEKMIGKVLQKGLQKGKLNP